MYLIGGYMKKIFYILILMFLQVITLSAPNGTVCHATNYSYTYFTNTTKFHCPSEIGNKTIEELYQLGYRVITSNFIMDSNGKTDITIIIEKISLK